MKNKNKNKNKKEKRMRISAFVCSAAAAVLATAVVASPADDNVSRRGLSQSINWGWRGGMNQSIYCVKIKDTLRSFPSG